MGVKRPDETEEKVSESLGSGHQQAAQQDGPAPGPRASFGRRTGPGAGLDINSTMRRPMARSTASETVNRYRRVMQECIEAEEGLDPKTFRLVTLDSAQKLTMYSSLLLVMDHVHKGVRHLVVHTMLVEASGTELAPRNVNIGGQQVPVTMVPGDAADEMYWQRICEAVHEQVGEGSVEDAGGIVIYNEVDPDDKDRIRQILFNAVQAVFTCMDNLCGGMEAKFSVSSIPSDEQLRARIDFGPQRVETANGLPQRSDSAVQLQVLANSGHQMMAEQVRNLTRMDGYVDFVYHKPENIMQQAWQQSPTQPPTLTYVPRFVITQSTSEVDAVTMELQLLALATSTLMYKDHAWAGVFRPMYNSDQDVDLRDIGAVGYEVNLTGDPNATPDRIDTKASDFDDRALMDLLQRVLHKDLVYSMDVEEFGEQSWINVAFIAASRGIPEAIDEIYTAADNLTDGHFSKLYGLNNPIAVDDENRIHAGYWIDSTGNKRDLREIDYLAMLNLMGAKDMTTVANYADTFDKQSIPLELRLEQREKILRGVLGDKMFIKGFHRRITFMAEFLPTLQAACANAGLIIRTDNMVQDFTAQNQRGNPSIQNFAVQPFNPAMFTRGGMQNTGGGMGPHMGLNRWRR